MHHREKTVRKSQGMNQLDRNWMLSTASPYPLQRGRIGAHKRSKRGLWVTIRLPPGSVSL